MNQAQMKKLQDRLKSLKEKKSGILAHFWRPQEGKNLVRLAPYAHGDGPFQEYYYHYNLHESGKPIVCPKRTYGRACAVCDLVSNLWKGDKDDQALAKQLSAKMRVHTPVLVRGEEDRGIRFWSFGQQVYQNVLETMVDPDYGDITDPAEGRDVVVTLTPPSTNSPFPQTDLLFKPMQTPLAPTSEAIETLLGNTPDLEKLIEIPDEAELQGLLATLAGDTGSPDEEGTEYNSKETDKDGLPF
jgi:hypothetical protein